MAKKFRRVDPRFWTDERVQQLPGAEETLLAVHMFTGPQTNRIGLYSFSQGMAAEHCRIPLDRFPTVMANVLEVMQWRFYAPRRVLWLPHWWRYNEPENPKVLIGNLGDLHDVPMTPLDVAFFSAQQDLRARRWSGGGNASETFLDTYQRRYPDRIGIVRSKYNGASDLAAVQTYLPLIQQEQKQEQEQERSMTTSAREGDQMRRAFEDRLAGLFSSGALVGEARKAAEETLEQGDWQRLEEVCAEAEGQPYEAGEVSVGPYVDEEQEAQ